MNKRVIVIGAGIGGLTAATELAHAGHDVVVLERATQPGGKLRQISFNGKAIDSGPTVMTMRWVFDELFATLGTSTEDQLTLQTAERLARHAWDADGYLDLYTDLQRSAAAVEAFAGPAEAQGFLEFSAEAERIYRSLEGPFIRGSRTGMLGLCMRFGISGLADLFRLQPYTPLWQSLGKYFRDERLRQLFGRYAGYCGSSPFLAPATLMLVAHAEREGVWMVKGGMYRIVEALTRLLHAAGGELRTNAHVARIVVTGGRVAGVELTNGERISGDAVISNADVSALGTGMFGDGTRNAVAPVKPAERSMSAITWSLLAGASDWPMIRHNVFFSADYRAEFADIFSTGRAPDGPTVYVCAQDRDDDGNLNAADGEEKLLVIVNAPADGDVRDLGQGELEQCTTTMFDHLERCGLKLRYQKDQIKVTTPAEFERMFPATGGALYGRASHGWMSSFRRAGARTRLEGLYLASGSVHPGPGVPMAMLSGRQAAASVQTDRSSTRR